MDNMTSYRNINTTLAAHTEPTKIVFNIDNQNALLGVEKMAMILVHSPEIVLRVVIYCSDGNITIRGSYYDGTPESFKKSYSLDLVNVELRGISSIEMERYYKRFESEIGTYERQIIAVRYTMKDGTNNIVYINRYGKGEATTNKGFKCVVAQSHYGMTDKKKYIIDGSRIDITDKSHEELLSNFRGYKIETVPYKSLMLPKTLQKRLNPNPKPTVVSIENKCGILHMNYHIFFLVFKIKMSKTGGNAILLNDKGKQKQYEWGLGDHEYRSDDGEYHTFTYCGLPVNLNNEKNVYGIAITTANFLIGKLVEPTEC